MFLLVVLPLSSPETAGRQDPSARLDASLFSSDTWNNNLKKKAKKCFELSCMTTGLESHVLLLLLILLVLFFVCVSIKMKFCSSELRQLSLVDLPVNQTPSVKGSRMSVPLFNITHKQVVIMMYLIFAVYPFAF